MDENADGISPDSAWDLLAKGWSEKQAEAGDRNQKWIINPALFHLIGEVDGKAVLDACCGGGHISRELARRGAEVTGVDISPAMIRIATERERDDHLGIQYFVQDISSMHEISSGVYDVVVSSMALMNVEPLEQAFVEFARVLRQDGRLVFSIPHPCFLRLGNCRGVFEKDAQGEEWLAYYCMTDYRSEGRYPVELVSPEVGPEAVQVPTFHRTLSTYVSLLVDAGFLVHALVEPRPSSVSEAKTDLGPGWWDAVSRIAYYLVVGARRMG